MTSVARLARNCAILLVLTTASFAFAQNADMKKAVDLYDQQEYTAAQEILLKLDVAKLSDGEKAEREQMLKQLSDAIAASKKAEQDKADGDKAMSLGDLDGAEKAYVAITKNGHAKASLRADAASALAQIAEKRKLAASAKPAVAAQSPDEPTPVAAVAGSDSMPPPQADSQSVTVVTEMQVRDSLLWQRAEARLDEMTIKAREAIGNKKFNDAREYYGFAEQTVESAKAYAEPVSRYEAAKVRLATLRNEIEDAARIAGAADADTQRGEVDRNLRERTARYEREKRERIEQLFSSAQQLRREQRLTEAVHVLREILILDPGNARAQNDLEIYQDIGSIFEQKNLDDDARREARNSLVKAQEAKVAWDYQMLYPKNWLQITARRAGAGVGRLAQSEEDAELNRALSESVPELTLNEQPLDTTIENLGGDQKINISVDWDDLAAAGVDRDRPITVSFKNVKLSAILKEIIAQSSRDVPLSYRVVDGMVRIATKEKLDHEKFVQVYDVRDLIVGIPRFVGAPKIDQTALANSNAGSPFTSGRGSLFSDAAPEDKDEEHTGIGDPAEIAKLLDVIRHMVSPDSWRETGTGDASLRELNGNIIVYNTSDAQQQVSDLLRQLRESRALQIAFEARFLTVSNNYLEEIGVDIDFVLNSATAKYDRAFTPGAGGAPTGLFDPYTGAPLLVPRQYGNIGATPAVPGFGNPLTPGSAILQPYGNVASVPQTTGVFPQFNNMTPVPVQNGSVALANPRNLNTGVPGSFAERAGLNPAFNMSGSFLDNLQVDFLIRATQATQRSTLVQAPRIMMFNGQRANISVGRNQQYVTSLRPQLAEGVAAVVPVVANAFSGTSLDVEGVVDADRKYVTVTVRTAQLKEPRFTDFETQRQSGNSPGLFVRLIDQETTSINTTVSIPDGGTVLMGGLKQVGEIEVEAGIPVLSKIPVLKRAFTNSTQVKDTQTLLILMKAMIVIQREAEDEAFPTMAGTESSN